MVVIEQLIMSEQDRFKDDEWVSFEFGVGGENKINSSSWILEDYKSARTERLGDITE